jgi:transcriptional regulator with XRE-family HTH domain
MLNERIRSLRLAKGLTLQAVADVFGITRASVSSWESGTNQPDPRKLEQLAHYLIQALNF